MNFRICLIFTLSLLSISSCHCGIWSWFTGGIEESSTDVYTEKKEGESDSDCKENKIEDIKTPKINIPKTEKFHEDFDEMTAKSFMVPGTVISGPTKIFGPDARNDDD